MYLDSGKLTYILDSVKIEYLMRRLTHP